MPHLRPRLLLRPLPTLGLLAALAALPHHTARAQCYQGPPSNMAYLTQYNTDGCDTNQWFMQAMFKNQIYTEGTTTVTGYCNETHYDCQCAYYPEKPHPGSLTFYYEEEPDWYDIWWKNESYTPASYTSCPGTTCDGEIETLNYTIFQVGYDDTLDCD